MRAAGARQKLPRQAKASILKISQRGRKCGRPCQPLGSGHDDTTNLVNVCPELGGGRRGRQGCLRVPGLPLSAGHSLSHLDLGPTVHCTNRAPAPVSAFACAATWSTHPGGLSWPVGPVNNQEARIRVEEVQAQATQSGTNSGAPAV